MASHARFASTRATRNRRLRATAAALAMTTLVACVPGYSARPDATGTQHYVSLGDSWVSGPLIGDQVGDPIDCGRSDQNFPSLIARQLDVAAFTDVSCGGGDITDLFEPGTANLGGRTRPQLDALRPDTSLVTVGVGGNDADISGLAIKCINLLPIPLGRAPFGQPCVERFVKGGVDEISDKIAATRPELERALDAIRERSPHASIYVLGYGAALPDTGDGCWPRVPLLPPDIAYVRAKMLEVNTMIRQVAAERGDHFVDLWAMTRGHDLCQPYGQAWLDALAIDPAGIPGHPNILYHQSVAPLIAAQILADEAADS